MAILTGLRGRLDVLAGAERLMGMDERAWRRHANPLSFWTRVAIPPLLALAVWSRVWIGWWCLVPVALLSGWAWLNPRAFPAPRTLDAWASRGVLGERLFLGRRGLARRGRRLPDAHVRACGRLTVAGALGLLPLAWGLIVLDAFAVLFGLTLSLGAKLWFIDRCVWMRDEAARAAGAGPSLPPTPLAPR